MSGEQTIGAVAFKARCLSLFERVAETGESIVVTKCGRAVAHIVLRAHLVVLILTVIPSAAQDHPHGSVTTEKLGIVHFQTSCAPVAQTEFDRAVALLHSFDFPRAVDGFTSSLKADGQCTIAYWGIALSRWGNPFAAGLKTTTQLQQGREAIERAHAAPPRTDRERAWVEAAARLYTNDERAPQVSRVLSYRDAMEALAVRYPDDTEASIFYALALAFASDPADKTYADQLKGGAILEGLFKLQPDHPGLAHYIIHTYEATLRKEPNRFRAVYGAAHAAALAGDRATARRYFTQLLKICDRADRPGRPELEEARR